MTTNEIRGGVDMFAGHPVSLLRIVTFEPKSGESAEELQIQRLLESRIFQASATYRDLLVYLAKKSLAGEGADLKEYTVGVDVLGKPRTYDPRQDSSARMYGGRLRQKIAEYYRTEGANDPILIDLPKGGFRVTFEPRAQVSAPPVSWKSIPRLWKGLGIASGILAVASLVTAGYFGVRLRNIEKSPKAEAGASLTPELENIWGPFLSSGRPLALCLSVPIFANVANFDGVVGPFPADWTSFVHSPQFANLKKRVGESSISPSYEFTDVAAAEGAFRLGQFLAGRAPNVLLTRSDLMTGPEVAMDNLVFLGSPEGNPQLQSLAANRQFTFGPDGIRNLHPGPGEPGVLPDVAQEEGFPVSHALITVAPTANGAGRLLFLTGNTEASIIAAVDAVTNPAVAKKVFSRVVSESGSLPRYFQVVIRARSMEEMPIDISYTAFKAIATSASSQ